jgi:hypothetical protein
MDMKGGKERMERREWTAGWCLLTCPNRGKDFVIGRECKG